MYSGYRSYDSQVRPKNQRRLTKKWMIVLAGFLLLIISLVSIHFLAKANPLLANQPVTIADNPTSVVPETGSQNDSAIPSQSVSEKVEAVIDPTLLTSSINNVIAANLKLSIGVSYINLDGGAQRSFGKTERFVGASTTKLVAAVDFLTQVEKGTYDINQVINGTKASYQIQQLINQSNNNS